MSNQDDAVLATNPNVRNFPKIPGSRVANDSTIAENRKRERDWVPSLTMIGTFVAFLGLLWLSINSQMSYLSTDIRELRTKTDNLDTRLDLVEKNLDTRLDLVEKNLDTRLDLVEKNLDARLDSIEKNISSIKTKIEK